MAFDPIATARRITSRVRAEGDSLPVAARNPARDLEAQGPQHWLRSTMPAFYSSPFGWFHKKFWEKTWAVEPTVEPPPLLLPWGRGMGKSMSIRGGSVMLAARNIRKFTLYFSGTQKQSDKHVGTVRSMLTGTNIGQYYPSLAAPMADPFSGSNVSWNRDRLVTESGHVWDSLGLDTASRGVNFNELRPDLIVIDDIDKDTDSLLIVLKKIMLLGTGIFPTGQDNTWVVFAQNVIHADSVMQQVMDGRAGILLDHEVIGPVKALKSYSYSKFIGSNGLPQYKILECVSSWPEGFSKERAEKALNKSGYEFFEREYQHNTKLALPGALYPAYSEVHHLSTWAEIVAAFEANGVPMRDEDGNIQLPRRWPKGMAHDFGTTEQHPSVLKWLTQPTQYEPFDDIWLWYRERCLPKFPHKRGEPIEPVSPIRICKLIREVEAFWQEDKNMAFRVMSHEQTAAQSVYRELPGELPEDWEFFEDEGLYFEKRKGDARSGIAQMQDRFEIDWTKRHPFRRYPIGYILRPQDVPDEYQKFWPIGEDVGGQPVIGRPRQVHIVANNQGALYLDSEGTLCVQQAIDDGGMIRSRAERPKYRNVATQEGSERNEPVKLFNDACDTERYAAEKAAALWTGAPPEEQKRRETEKIMKEQYPHLTTAALAAREPDERQGATFARQFAERRIHEEMDKGHTNGSALINHRYRKQRR